MGNQILVRGAKCGEMSAEDICSTYFCDVFPNTLLVCFHSDVISFN